MDGLDLRVLHATPGDVENKVAAGMNPAAKTTPEVQPR
jgi:hypothetical protein